MGGNPCLEQSLESYELCCLVETFPDNHDDFDDYAKTLKYASSYGAQPPKLAKQMNWPLEKAKQVFEAFWEASSPLKSCLDTTKKEWENNRKKYIKGLDGRKLFVRSPHSIGNMLFQNAGVTCAKRAAVWWDRQVQKEGLKGVNMMCMYHKYCGLLL